ncbi:MAG: pentapeptide repeat-containing protein, partial [Polyangiaceae bacterium]|nr:pentapeptide repeat-containing protein [Polyangiaceae bacterium]
MLRSVEELLDRYAAGQRRFRSVQLSAASLPGSELSNADFTGATFRRADLREVDFTGTVLRRASLRGANLLDANLGGADLGGADLRDTTLTGADLSRVDARCAELSFSRLRHADLVGADLRDVNFRQADLRRANLAEANLVGANLEGVTLDGADVQGAQIDLDALRSARLVLLSARWSSLLVEGTVLSREDVEFGESQPFDLEQPLRFSFRARGLTGTGIDALNRALRHASRASKSDLMTVNFGGRWGEDAESAIDSRARNPEDACLGLVFYVLAWRLQQRRLAGQRDGDRPLVLSGTPGLDSQCELVDALSRLELRRVEFRTPHDKQVFLQRAGALLCSANIAGYRSLGGGLG